MYKLNNPKEMTTIKVKSITGNMHKININTTDTGLSLKHHLEEITECKYDQIRLLYNGKMLNDNITLIDQNICHDNIIYMILVVRGG